MAQCPECKATYREPDDEQGEHPCPRCGWSRDDLDLELKQSKAHREGCKGYKSWTDWGYEYDCGYDTIITCDDCKYSERPGGRKNPAAKCNRVKT